jgi:hypothetical protein
MKESLEDDSKMISLPASDLELQAGTNEFVSTPTATAFTASIMVATISPLLQFLMENQDCFKNCTAYEYYEWLQSEDVDSLLDFAEAIQDDDFSVKMKQHGIKVIMFYMMLLFI